MRSRDSGYLADPSDASRFYAQPLASGQRSSKGWFESGELKSVYKPEVTASRDSIISGDSHRSYRSGRSSSRSSGTMSSSRDSLENLLEGGGQRSLECHPQPMLRSKYRSAQQGIVSQQKHMFERLSHDASPNGAHNKSIEDSSNRSRHLAADEAEKRHRESRKSPSHTASGQLELTPSRKNSNRERAPVKDAARQDSLNMRNESIHAPPTSIKYSDAKIVKTTAFDLHKNASSRGVPEPPQRDRSSAIAVKNLSSRGVSNAQVM